MNLRPSSSNKHGLKKGEPVEIVHGHARMAPPDNVPVWDIDPYDRSVMLDQAGFGRELLKRGPFVYFPKYSILACGRYEVVREVFSDWRRFSNAHGEGMDDLKLVPNWRPPSIVLEVDPPDHNKTRPVIQRAMSPKVAGELVPMLRKSAETLIAKATSKPSVEAQAELSEPFICEVFPQLVGMVNRDDEKAKDYGLMATNAFGPDNELRRSWLNKGAEANIWINQQTKRENIGGSGFARTIFNSVDAGDLSEEEGRLVIRSIFSAGLDTTIAGISSVLLCLAKNPDQFEKLKSNPALARVAFEESVRVVTPFHSLFRTSLGETRVAGIKIPRYAKILCSLPTANRDPRKWNEPDKFDLSRDIRGSVSFGYGIHSCVGMHVARVEVETFLTVLAEKVEQIELVGDPVWLQNNAVQMLEKLPLRLRPRKDG